MKKIHLWIASGLLLIGGLAWAGNQYNWGTSTGSSWTTPDDTKTTQGQILVIGSSGGANVIAGGSLPIGIPALSSTTIAGLTASATGQIVFEASGLTANSLCISTGSTTNGQFVLVGSTNSICK